MKLKTKKILKYVFLALTLIIIGLLIYAAFRDYAPANYWEKISTTSEYEKKYNSLGKYTVEFHEYDIPKSSIFSLQKHYGVFYPKEEGNYPLLVIVNGTGVPYQNYKAVFEHIASWGYVVVGNDYRMNWKGDHASDTLYFALNTPKIAEKIDENKIAIGGHSQGGMGAFNAITEYSNGKKYKVAFSLSPANNDLALKLRWGFNLKSDGKYAFRLEKISIPMLIVAGTGPYDSKIVSPLDEVIEEYNSLEKNDKVMMRRSNNIEHGHILYEANGYVIAWLDYYLKDVKENEKIFFGNNPEILNNPRYQNFKSEKKK